VDTFHYPCFLLDPTDMMQVNLRRYKSLSPRSCSGPWGQHDAQHLLGNEKIGPAMSLYATENGPIELSDSRWPVKCDYCDYRFKDDDHKKYFTKPLYRHAATGELMTLQDAPIGAMWFADEFNQYYENRKGADGRTLIVRTPGGDWCIDDRASNCDSPCKNCGVPYILHQKGQGCGCYQDSKPGHKCWVRHGDAPHITVDKNGLTCGAGAGSYQSLDNRWHGFLKSGVLQP
jgi:hypothetical protein